MTDDTISIDNASDAYATTSARVGDIAPDFALCDPAGETWRLSEHRGQVVALLFYPGDETLVCTRQLCAVRDRWEDYLATGAEVVGISPGTGETHARFAAGQRLPMPLLSDEDRRITKQYAAHRLLPIQTTRALVVIDAQGIIRHRHIVLRAFRPTNTRILTAIHLAQYDQLVARLLPSNRSHE